MQKDVISFFTNCKFEACDILEISDCYEDKFDLILLTIGAIPCLIC